MKTFLTRLQGMALALLTLSPASQAADSMTTAASISDARMVHNAALLPDGRVLIVGGSTVFNPAQGENSGTAGQVTSSQIFDPVTGLWISSSAPGTSRKLAAMATLPNGTVSLGGGMKANGFGQSIYTGTFELFDPESGTWANKGPFIPIFNRARHTATILPDGRMLFTGGDGGDPGCFLVAPATGVPTATGSLNTLLAGHTATLLPNGTVLVDGGSTFSTLNTQLYNPATGTWSAAASSSVLRLYHTATLLPDGKVLVAGGSSPSSNQALSQAQLYDPVANTWASTGSLNSARYGHSATLLPNGKVAVMGGLGTTSTLSSVELYDAAAGTWSTSTASLATARKFHTATLLTNGRVVIVGGSSSADAVLASVEIFSSSSPAWSATGAMGSARAYTQPVMLPDGKILVPGGYNGADLSTADLYNPATGTWSSAGTMVSAHTEGTATLLPNGKVLLAGHRTIDAANKSELYDPVAGTWTALPNMPSLRSRHTATLLSSGKVLISGGGLPSGLAASLLFDPASNSWNTSGSLATGRLWHTATALPNGKVLVTGGASQFAMDSFGSCELYDAATGTWSTTNAMAETRQRHSATLLPNGKVLVVGGLYMSPTLIPVARATVELFDPATGTWSSTGSLATARYDHRAELLPDGRVLIAGGTGTGAALSSTEIYNPATGTWSSGPVLSTGRTGAYLGLLTTGKVLIAGGTSGSAFSTPYLNTAELLDLGLGYNSAWQPQVTTASINAGRVLSITGTALRGISGASGGGTQDSATDLPRVQLRSLGNAQIMWARPTSSSATGFTSTALGAFAPGHLLMTVFTNGIPSESKVLTLPLGPEITVEQPVSTNIADGGSQSFGSLTNGTSTPLTFTVKNSGDGALSLTGVSVTGGNASDFVVNSTGMSSSVAAGGSTSFTVTFTPSAAGSRSTTLQILSDDYDEATFDISLSGNGVNAAPTISDIANQTINEDANTGAIAFTIGDFETAAASLTVTRASSNTTLVPLANIVLGGSGTSRTVTVTPAANLSGSAIITVTVSDGTVSTSDTFNLTVNAVNDTPTLNSITNPAALPEDSGQQTVNLSGIGAGGGETQALTVTATSDNTALIPTPSVTYTSPNTTGSLLYTPAANMSGTATITVTVNDGQAANNTFSRTFLVAVNSVNDAPTLDVITSPAAINEDAGLQTINLTGISAGPSESQTLVITATSNNTALIPNPTVSYTSPNTPGVLSYTPVANANGSATITVTVNDQQASNNILSRTFTVTVNAVNDAPTISDITDQTINEDGNTGALAFTIGDMETSASSLTVTHSSSNTTLVPGANVVFGGSGASRTVTFTPAANQSGTAIITMTVSDGTTTTSDTFNLTVNAVNDPPTLNSITSPGTIQEDAVQQTVLLSGISAGPNESQTLTITATSNNTALIPNPTVSYTGPGTSGSVLYTPVANMSGTATITVTVNDGQVTSNTISQTFNVIVNAVNDAPTLDAIANPAPIDEDAGPQTINLTGISAGPLESQTLLITATSNFVGLIDPVVDYNSPNATGRLTYTPGANISGTAIITVTVYDQQASNFSFSRSFSVTVNPVNDAPIIDDIANRSVNEDVSTGVINVIIGDQETAPSLLTLTAASDNTTLVPNSSFTFGGSHSIRTLTILPAPNLSGVATITVTVSDGVLTTTDTFVLTVNSVNDAPTMDAIAGPVILDEDAATQVINLTGINAGPGEPQSLTLFTYSDNPTLIPTPSFTYTSPGSTGTISFTPAANRTGVANISISINDGQASNNLTIYSFTVYVNPVNDPPAFNAITNPAAIAEDSGQQSVNLSGISSGPLESQVLTITATSNNTALIPNPTVSYTSPNTTGSVLYTPVANMSGTATVTVTVNDSQAVNNTFSRTFTVTVNAVNDAPTLDAIANPAAIAEDSGLQTINLSGITAGPLETQTMLVTATSSNTSLIPHPTVSYTSPNATGSLSYTPVANANGSATITVTVNDQQASNNTISRTFTVMVNAVNDTPTISDIANQSIDEDASTGALAFTVGDLETVTTSLTVSGSSTNTTLVPNGNIAFGGSGANRTVTVTPAANQSGSATITITVSDGFSSASDTFVLTVTSTNDAPTITSIADQVITYNTLTNTLNFTVGDVETDAASLTVTGNSSDVVLLPHSSILLSGSGANRGVTLAPTFNQTGVVTITLVVSDGSAIRLMSFTLTVNAPEIVVEQPFTSGIADGGTRGFGNVAVGSTSSLVFYIRNTNAATLTGLTITKDGTDASQFIITASPVSPVNGPGGNTAFTVQFAPSSAGAKTCALHIANNDPDESPFDITLTGNGTVPQTNWRQTYFGSTSNSGNGGDLADPDNDGVPNLLEYALGLHPGQNSAGQMPQAVRSGGDLVYTFTEPAGVTGITYSAEWSETLQTVSWTSAGITHTVNNRVHTFILPVGTAPGAFIRLRVTTP